MSEKFKQMVLNDMKHLSIDEQIEILSSEVGIIQAKHIQDGVDLSNLSVYQELLFEARVRKIVREELQAMKESEAGE